MGPARTGAAPASAASFVVTGVVQGVGFRPFVHRLASSLALRGEVANEGGRVRVHVEGDAGAIDAFERRLADEAPAAAAIEAVERRAAEPAFADAFRIRGSTDGGERALAIGPDLATCADCLAEVLDPGDRRHRYPFTNCTACGPRYTIVEALPYDRARTSMRGFEMCDACRAEYEDAGDRRFHAQPNACPACGPQLGWAAPDGAPRAAGDAALAAATAALLAGEVVAVQGLGGFHLMVRADDGAAVARLRERKQRGDKPFAVMFRDAGDVRARLGADALSDLERDALASPAAPIVLVRTTGAEGVAPEVAPASPDLGCLVASNPLQHLLLGDVGVPLVATSGNRRGEPLATDAAEAARRLAGIADAFLTHDRPIVRPIDDSIVRVVDGAVVVLRRARGFAPLAFDWDVLPEDGVDLAVGPHMKTTVGVRVGRRVVLSPHVGDLDTPLAREQHERSCADLQDLVGERARRVVCDRHPDYASVHLAERLTDAPVRVQHHLAHVWAAALDHRLDGPFLALAWDGTGHGEDGTVWGGEAFLRDGAEVRRVASFQPFALPGGERAVREPWRVALGLVDAAFGDDAPEALTRAPRAAAVALAGPRAFDLCRQVARGPAPRTSSVGRLFDAVAAILGICSTARFEAEGAQRLEHAAEAHRAAERGPSPAYPVEIHDVAGSPGAAAVWRVAARPWLAALAGDLDAGAPAGQVAARFHATLVEVAVQLAARTGRADVALTGGCFQNRLLLERTIDALRAAGHRPLAPHRIPPNDGGIAAGQLVAAAFGATRPLTQA